MEIIETSQANEKDRQRCDRQRTNKKLILRNVVKRKTFPVLCQ